MSLNHFLIAVAFFLCSVYSFNFTTGWADLSGSHYWQATIVVPPIGEALFHFSTKNDSQLQDHSSVVAICAKLLVQPVDRPGDWKNFCQKDVYFEFHLNASLTSTGAAMMRPGLYYVAIGVWPAPNASLPVQLDITATDCPENMTGTNCTDVVTDAVNNTIHDQISANGTQYYRFEVEDQLSAFANFSFDFIGEEVNFRVRYLSAPSSLWFDSPSETGDGWQAFSRPGPVTITISLETPPVDCEPPLPVNCTPSVTNLTGSSALKSLLPSTPIQYYSIYNRNGSEFRVSITDPDGLNSSKTPSVYLKWGNLPALDSWDAKDDEIGPRLVRYIATNHTIEGNWYIAVTSDIPRPYALWLYSICPNDCHEDSCIASGPREGQCDCKDLVHSLDCAADVAGWLEWGIVVALLIVTLLVVLAGAVHYSLRRRALVQQLRYAPIAANTDS